MDVQMTAGSTIKLLEDATRGTPELSTAFLQAIGKWPNPAAPSPAENLQHAVELLPAGWRVFGASQSGWRGPWFWALTNAGHEVVTGKSWDAAPALCAAILKAHEAMRDEP